MSRTTWPFAELKRTFVSDQESSEHVAAQAAGADLETSGSVLTSKRRSLDRRQLLRAGGMAAVVTAVGAEALGRAEPAAAWSFDARSYTTPVAFRCWPVSQWYGTGSHTSGENARAIDIGCPSGTPVYAPKDGVIAFEGWEGVGGIVCRINHSDGLQTILAHLSQTVINNGNNVRGGYTLIGYSGATGQVSGPHLHWALKVQGTSSAIALDGIPGVSRNQICP